jgi:hypothetical protein
MDKAGYIFIGLDGWSVSNSMSAECKTEVMRAALYMHGKSEIFKTNH